MAFSKREQTVPQRHSACLGDVPYLTCLSTDIVKIGLAIKSKLHSDFPCNEEHSPLMPYVEWTHLLGHGVKNIAEHKPEIETDALLLTRTYLDEMNLELSELETACWV